MNIKPLPRKILKIALRTIAGIFLFTFLYVVIGYLVMFIPVNTAFKECGDDAISIYILSNGVHTDIVVPIKNEYRDWSSMVDPSNTASGNKSVNYVAFGWGDKGFYLETPTWNDLKFKTAFNAMFFLGTSAMHVTFYEEMTENKACRKISISSDNYLKLLNYLDQSFQKLDGKTMLIKGASYSDNDNFYEANGTYNLFFTCNTWANNALSKSGLRACAWTAMDKGIFYQYEK